MNRLRRFILTLRGISLVFRCIYIAKHKDDPTLGTPTCEHYAAFEKLFDGFEVSE